ncbi:putative acetyltransferase [Pontibacter mucosus]|uniref:Putative acetyltransferase n=1 Tax=Pontibacter mucosus TaxID=1649266 RepID=A0A2T5YJZ6_9BACT|nr:GNAT family N-acetyltransferase [Pontibacter mucosus]PTX19625.1 putative acetyltransferase [Pontibacter mucosus]
MQHTQPQQQIYKAAPEDFTALAEVWEASVRATHHFLSEADIQFYKPLVRDEYLKLVEVYYVRDAKGQIAGFVGTADRKVEMLFIHPERRGEGIGKKLLQYAVQELQASAVDVNEQNEQAVGFYEHFGFRTISRSELDSMGKPYPILHMQLP